MACCRVNFTLALLVVAGVGLAVTRKTAALVSSGLTGIKLYGGQPVV